MVSVVLSQFDMSLRSACIEDKELLFQWRNKDEIVSQGTSQKKVTWDEHSEWFNAALASSTSVIYIIYCKHYPVGQIRFSHALPNETEISIYLIPGETGKGRGSYLIKESCRLLFSNAHNIDIIKASIRSDNHMSVRAFTNAGFTCEPPIMSISSQHDSISTNTYYFKRKSN